MMMLSVSAVMEACAAGSLEMTRGWNTLNGFLGKCYWLHFSVDSLVWCQNVLSRALCTVVKVTSLYLHV